MTRMLPLLLLIPLAACGMQLPFGLGNRAPEPDAAAVETETLADVEAEADATAEASAPGVLGTTLATLGDATVAGLWLETPLVTAPGPGLVTAADGTSAEVQLIPSGGLEGSGSRLSLAAMQALGLSLTDIAEVTVEAL